MSIALNRSKLWRPKLPKSLRRFLHPNGARSLDTGSAEFRNSARPRQPRRSTGQKIMDAAQDRAVPPVCYSTGLKYVFIHIPKCAGTSVHRALGRLHQRLSILPDRRRYHKHLKAAAVREILGPVWDNAFTFSYVRNPWDLMVSSYYWWTTHASAFPPLAPDAAKVKAMKDFGEFIRSDYGRTMINEQVGTDCCEWLTADGETVVDFVGKFENLDADWRKICEALNVTPIELTRENAVSRPHYRTFYDAESRDLIAQRFARTIEKFDYQF